MSQKIQASLFTKKHTGSLYISTNYSVKKIIESKHNTQFTVFGAEGFKNLIITQKTNFHQKFNPNSELDIYYFPYDLKGEVTFLGKGKYPQVHQKGNFITYYKPANNKIIVKKLSLPSKTYSIPISNSANPFFTPEVLMQNDSSIIVYEQNSSGIGNLKLIDLDTQKSTLIKKLNNYYERLEMCLIQDQIYLLETGYVDLGDKKKSFLRKLDISSKKEDTIYESDKKDLGQISCNVEFDHIYFIKNFGIDKKDYFDVVKLNIKNKTFVRVTYEDYITNLFEMDGRLIALNDGVQMLLYGENSLKRTVSPL